MNLQTLLLAAALAAPVQATETDQADAFCIAAAEKLSEVATGEDKAGIQGTMLYFFGRLTGRHEMPQVRALIAEARGVLAEDQVPVHGERCGNELIQAGEAVGI